MRTASSCAPFTDADNPTDTDTGGNVAGAFKPIATTGIAIGAQCAPYDFKGQFLKPTVYVETSIVSYLSSRPSNDIRVAASQNTTIEWWETRRPVFDLYVSEFVLTEAGFGHPDAANRRMAVLKDIPELATVEDVRILGKALIAKGSLPVKAEIDAYHIAVAAVHGIEYLLTWNCTHIANAVMRPKIEFLCREFGYEPPIICTPQELMEG